jgi:hypothetical protein
MFALNINLITGIRNHNLRVLPGKSHIDILRGSGNVFYFNDDMDTLHYRFEENYGPAEGYEYFMTTSTPTLPLVALSGIDVSIAYTQ